MRIMLIAATLALSGCAGIPYADIGTGINKSFTNDTYEWEDQGAAAFLGEVGIEWIHPNELMTSKCRYLHLSQINAGTPFDNRPESSVDHFGCSVGVRWKR